MTRLLALAAGIVAAQYLALIVVYTIEYFQPYRKVDKNV